MKRGFQKGRRKFFKLIQAGIITGYLFPLSKPSEARQVHPESSAPIPPGAQSIESFRKTCTACQLCVSQCPLEVIKPAFLENGLSGFMQPILRYDVHSFCDYECRKCIEVCPTKALGSATLEEKKLIRIGMVQLIQEECIVLKNNKSCGACAEHCPTGALRMVPYKPGLTKPEIVDRNACVGCGGCESICPVRKLAIYVERLDVHELAAKPKVVKKKLIEVEDFGF